MFQYKGCVTWDHLLQGVHPRGAEFTIMFKYSVCEHGAGDNCVSTEYGSEFGRPNVISRSSNMWEGDVTLSCVKDHIFSIIQML